MIIEGVLLGILVGKLRGGGFKRLGYSVLRFSWMIFFAFSLQLLTSIMIFLGHPIAIKYRMILYVLSYGLLIMSLFFNIQFKSMWLIMIGAIANFAAILLNGGSMPIDMDILKKMGFKNLLSSIESGALPHYIPLEEAGGYTRYLGKILTTPNMYPLKQIFSIGDILVVVGIFFLIQNMMIPTIYHRTSKVLQFDHKGKVKK